MWPGKAVALALLLLSLACWPFGSGEPAPAALEPEPAPTAVPVDALATALPAARSGYGGRERLAFATPDPTPTATPRPTPAWPTATLFPGAPGYNPTATPVPEYPVYCLTHYRDLLVEWAHSGPEFHPDDVYRVGVEFGELRPDCLEQGFAPEASFGLPCRTGWGVDGMEVSVALLGRAGDRSLRELGPTGRDAAGNIMVQFNRLPYRDRAGCWYYHAGLRLWAWRIEPEGDLARETGRQTADLTICDNRLRERMAAGFDRLSEVAGMVDAALAELDHCRGRGWRPYPQEVKPDGCTLPEDEVWVYWHPDYRPYDGSFCWARER